MGHIACEGGGIEGCERGLRRCVGVGVKERVLDIGSQIVSQDSVGTQSQSQPYSHSQSRSRSRSQSHSVRFTVGFTVG